MIDALYGIALTVAFLVVLAASVPVLAGIVRDARERRRKRRAGELDRYAEDEEYGPGPPEGSDDADPLAVGRVFCRSCETENEAEFAYCRRCGSRL